MFIKYLYHEIRKWIEKEYDIYKLIMKFENLNIRKPFSIINSRNLELGKNITIQRNCHFHCGGLEWSDGKGKIKIGDNCLFSENNILYGSGEIEIGNNVGTGPGVMIFSSRDNYSKKYAEIQLPKIIHHYGKVTIGSNVKIFSNVIITPGVSIGEGSVIGAGSIVTKDIPPWKVVFGTPIRIIGDRGEDNFLLKKNKRI